MGVPNIQEIMDLIKKGLTLEAQEKIMELREKDLELQEENLQLKEQLKTLEQQLEIKGKLVFKDGQYWLKIEGKEELDGPFCQRCWDVDGKLVRTQFYKIQ
jgi:DNA-binding transcriptional MerR regulator